MNILEVSNLTKNYGATRALEDVSFSCEEGEFFTLFGPSGAGKTTILELIAGIKEDYTGSIAIKGKKVDDLPIQMRNVAMAFENYALYPHLTVRGNIEFPLISPRAEKKSPAERDAMITRVATDLGIEQLLDRNPTQLSGGQKQRVALARALVRPADIYLLDEPIAHLDAKLRSIARANLKAMARDLGAMILYVTHDFREALGLSDRLLILKEGEVQQIGTPREIYNSPATDYVAHLIGDPTINLVDGMLRQEKGAIQFSSGPMALTLTDATQQRASAWMREKGNHTRIGIRPSAVTVSPEKRTGTDIALPVFTFEKGPEHNLVYFEGPDFLFGGLAARETRFATGEEAWISLQQDQIHFFEKSFELGQ